VWKNRVFWIGAGVPAVCTEFGKVQIYFHPTVVNSGVTVARDGDYPTFTGGWSGALQRYVGYAGLQIAAARATVVLVPFNTMAATKGGADNMFSDDGLGLLTAVMTAVQQIHNPYDPIPPVISQIGVTSFSNGIGFLKTFLGQLGPSGLIREIIDLDSPFIIGNPRRLTRYGGAVSRCFAQVPPDRPESGYVYLAPGRFPDSEGAVHGQIGWAMYYSAMLSSVML
jgi:hypothetical protein